MRLVYNIIFLALFALSSPYYFFRMQRRGNWQKGFGQRFGQYDNKIKQSITNRHVLWMHAVSVGEMSVCMELIRALEPRLPNIKIMVSTTTTTGMAELQKKLPTHIGKIYYPVDRRKYVARAMGTIHPDAIILVEAEIWPNFIWRARSLGTPLFLINARLSDRSYPRYKRFGFLFRQLFASFTGVEAQSEEYARKLLEVGCRPEAVQMLGNLKFDCVNTRAPLDVSALLAQLGVAGDALILVGGSTHDGEEEMLAAQFMRLRQRFPKLFLVLVPRHFERAKEIGRMLSKHDLRFFYRAEIAPDTQLAPGSLDCLLVNTTGELVSFYKPATVVFVGKSMTAKGGQNPIEPAALCKPTVFGPNMQNFSDVARIFISQRGAIQVGDAEELERTFAELLADPARREELGNTAQKIVQQNQGAVARTVEMIVKHLRAGDLYIAPQK
ncbi:MAG: Three-deoxy-D-manno-octulosonic-acid transferase domain protein [Pedosphaera sp.]|nr:Three-deoxy-D-manno-octulosonic-acid transferase domain protein [Pedosphaera sp.]